MFYKDDLLYQDDSKIKERKYIFWLFRLLLAFVVLCLVLLFTIRTDDTVEFSEGEIISSNPQMDVKAPFEAQLREIYVKEGQKINNGDTLLVIYNEEKTRELIKQKAEKDYLDKNLLSVKSLLAVLARKEKQVGSEAKINYSDHNLDVQNIINNLQTLDEQNKLQQQKLATALERNKADSILYRKDMLSKFEFNSDWEIANNIKEAINLTQSEMQKQKTQRNVSANDLLKKQQETKLKGIEQEESEQNLQQVQARLQNELIQTNENIVLLNKELANQYIIATGQGVVNFIYNAKQASNIINKGDLLLSISPANANSFYAKVEIPQNNIQYVQASMAAHLKLDAYYHLEYGIIKGTVTYVSERKENGKFYALINLNNTNNFRLKSGYNISGEIITDRLVLFQYLAKKLFKEFDKKK